jgi:hypothetical protein
MLSMSDHMDPFVHAFLNVGSTDLVFGTVPIKIVVSDIIIAYKGEERMTLFHFSFLSNLQFT